MEVMPNVNYALPSKNKDQPRDFYNNLNHNLNSKMIAAINTLDGSTLGDNLNRSHQAK